MASQVGLVVKNPPGSRRDLKDVGLIPGSGRSLEEALATGSSILAWRIPRTRSLVGYDPEGDKKLDMTEAT